MRPLYEFGKVKFVDELLSGTSIYSDSGNPLLTAVTRARGEGFWLSPEVLAAFMPHTKARDALSGSAVRDYEHRNSFSLHNEAEAMKTSEALRSWAENYDPAAIAKEDTMRKLEQERAEFVGRRIRQLEIEEDIDAARRRTERAEAEWQASINPNTKGREARRKAGVMSDAPRPATKLELYRRVRNENPFMAARLRKLNANAIATEEDAEQQASTTTGTAPDRLARVLGQFKNDLPPDPKSAA